ncbi:hypothetical protein [Gymnodinialimonas hymeniacidonis]|uniref:hypothetical protein n=1 Tax=Gymnodinialimonas hymeniacidonis TaxID=3126508 RepID=UPI0034C6459E
MGDLTIDMSEQVHEQTKAINHISTVASEARRAAKAAEKQTDPEHYGELVGQTVEGRLDETIKKMDRASVEVLNGIQRCNASFQETTTMHSKTLSLMGELREQHQKDRQLSRWVGLGGVVLAVVVTIVLPRFIASFEEGCVVLGGTWTQSSTGVDVCVFPQP